ncbi:MAG: LysM domain-containing protein [Caldilineaceae bacterium]
MLVVLFLVVMVQRWGSGSPAQWVQAQLVTSRSWVNQLAEQLDPQITIATLPEAVAEANGASTTTAPQTDGQSDGLLFTTTGDAAPDQVASLDQERTPVLPATGQEAGVIVDQPTAALGQSATVTPTATLALPTATALPSRQPTATPLPPTATATTPATPTPAEATVTATAAATVAPTVAATATLRQQPKAEAIVETLPEAGTPTGGIGGAVTAANAATDAPTAAPTDAPTAVILQPTATPEPTLTPTPPPTVAPTPATKTYTIRSGDTPLVIANAYGISVNELLAYNGLSLDDARRLRVGQVLVIPTDETPVEPTSTATAVITAVPAAPTTAATVAADVAEDVAVAAAPSSPIRVDAPVLRSPEVGSSLSCSAVNSLIWLPVAFIRESDQYLLHLGFLSGYNGDGSEQVTWILEQWRPSNVTLWDLDQGLCGLAPQAFGRQWRWYVEVMEAADGGWRSVSPSSQIWGFSWN